jgi:hypothetical protein
MRFATKIWSDQFHRDDTVDEDVPGAVNDAHPSFTDSRLEAIATGNDFAERGVFPSFA